MDLGVKEFKSMQGCVPDQRKPVFLDRKEMLRIKKCTWDG